MASETNFHGGIRMQELCKVGVWEPRLEEPWCETQPVANFNLVEKEMPLMRRIGRLHLSYVVAWCSCT